MSAQKNKPSAILFVDDEPSILSSLKRELHDWARERGIELLTASSAREGGKILEARADEVAVLVSDLRMPEKLGSDFLLEVKEKWPDIVTILLTGFSEAQEIMKAVKAGIFSYILKPWEPEYLQSEVDKAVEFRLVRAQNKAYSEVLKEELKWAGEMQKAILKPNLVKSPGIEFRSSYRPVPGLYCGGDYYDVITLNPDRYLLLVGDVAGHGVKAAFITGILKAVIFPEYVRNLLGLKFSPAAFLGWLNERMNFELRQTSDLLITFFAAVLDRAAMTFTYANAGQDHPFIVSAGLPRELPVSGSGLGFARSVMYSEKVEVVRPGDLLFIATDGIVEVGAKERTGPSVSMREILTAVAYGPEFHKRIMEAALQRSGATEFEDDITILTAYLE
jgi:sigma-B regulation protein RsbU (phosphoserine phosphatase)